MSSIGINVGFTFTSCATSLPSRGLEAHTFGGNRDGDASRWIRTSVFCQATSTLDGSPLMRSESGHTSLRDILPSLVEMSHSPLEFSSNVHPSAHHLARRAGGSHHEPHAFLWSLFQEATASSHGNSTQHDALLQMECATMEAAVFFVWVLRHIADRMVADRYASIEDTRGSLNNTIVVDDVVVSLPSIACYAAPHKVDAIVVALDAALAVVQDGYRGAVVVKHHRIVPDAIAAIGASTALLPRLTPTDRGTTASPQSAVALVCHVGAATCTFSFVQTMPASNADSGAPTGAPLTLLSCVGETSSAGGDAVDQAILHHILTTFQHAYIDHPLSGDAKMILLERIRVAKEHVMESRSAVDIALLGGPAVQDPSTAFKLKVDVVESIATDVLFRKFTKVLQQSAAGAQQVAASSSQSQSVSSEPESSTMEGRRKAMESLALNAMRTLRPTIVVTHGRSLWIPSLRKRVESLCRTLGASTSEGASGPVAFYHAELPPSTEGSCALGAITASSWARGGNGMEGLRQTCQQFSHRCRFSTVASSTDNNADGDDATPLILHGDVLVKVHGDSWGLMVPRGATVPVRRTRRLELLNRTPDVSAPTSSGSGRFSLGSTAAAGSGGLINAVVELGIVPAGEAAALAGDVEPLVVCEVWLPKLSAAEGGSDRFAVSLDISIDHQGSMELVVVHGASGTVLRKHVSVRALVAPPQGEEDASWTQ